MEPIERIEWRDADSLRANFWNPNRVAKQEFELLELSLLTNGWIQPILINSSDLLIDGFHRWLLSRDSTKVRERWDGRVPCVVFDIPDDEAMALTVRINKAKGRHMTTNFQDILKDLFNNYGWTKKRLKQEFGLTADELRVLLAEDIFGALGKLDKYQYSQAWYPSSKD